MLGTIVNFIAIIACACIGLAVKGRFNERLQEITVQATGLAVVFVGASGAFANLLNEPCNSILFVISLVLGGLIGTIIDIEGNMKRLGDAIEARFKNSNGSISKSFVSASILYCTGTMAILGAVEGGLYHNYSILFTKSVLDGVYAIIFASTMGIGVMFAGVSVFVYQGAITILAGFVEPYLTGDIMRELSLVGSILITGLGIDMLGIRKINVANLLPSVFIPVIYYALYYIIF